MNQPDVSVAMMTYFHEKYVAQAIESVLSQQTNYTYEIVIADDCSQDGTREILKLYQKKYPDIIRLIFNEKNLGISANNYNVRCHCKGRYIATLSGDDYWIDNNKIEKQVSFLDEHTEYIAAVTSVEARYDDDKASFMISPQKKYRGKAITMEMYLNGAVICTHSLMMRNLYLTDEGKELFSLVPKASPYVDDSTECLLMLKISPIQSMDFCSAAYRVPRSKKGKNNYNSRNTVVTHVRKMISLYNNLDEAFDHEIDLFNMYKANVAKCLAYSIYSKSFKDFRGIYASVPIEYRSRGLLRKSIFKAINTSWKTVINKVRKI